MARTGGSISGRRRRRGTTDEPEASTALVKYEAPPAPARRPGRPSKLYGYWLELPADESAALVPAERRPVIDAEIVTKREHVNALAGTRLGKWRPR